MRLEHTFTIDASIDQAWAAFADPSTVAPCFPGAELTAQNGDTFTGNVKVKLGPIAMLYKGNGSYQEKDENRRQVVILATGRDTRGNGTASATVTGTLRSAGPTTTEVSVGTDMSITGRPAQFGRGVLSDVANSILNQFAACLATSLSATLSSAPAVTEAQDALDLLGSSGGALVRRALPVVTVVGALGVIAGLVMRWVRR